MLEAQVSCHTRAKTTSTTNLEENHSYETAFSGTLKIGSTLSKDDSTRCCCIAFPGRLKIEFEVEQGIGA
jgi:hypothetical protein